MCGIAGIYRLNGNVNLEEIKTFTDSLRHRGPDGSGYELLDDGQLALGHRRLSILDLSEGGKQPMYGIDDRYCITYNGEVYNFIEIRKELQGLGYTFKTTSDTEVILAAYHQWKDECFHKFNGMWAIGIWDKAERKLLLSRDRFGVKPLFYSFIPGKELAFASETIAFKYLKDRAPRISDRNFVYAMQDMATVEAMGYTIYDNVFQLLPGHLIRFDKNSNHIKQERWWHTYEHLVKPPQRYEEQVEQFYELFKDACRIRMRSDVPIASALSGGMDSSSVYCMLHHLMSGNDNKERISDNWQKAFVGIFPDTPVDEKKYADEVINYIGVPPVYVPPDYKNLAQDVVNYTRRMDAITNTPITVVSDIYKAMHDNGIVVSMDGHGADELLFGYVASVKEVYYTAETSGDSEYSDDILNTYLNTLPGERRAHEKEITVKRGKYIADFEKRLHTQPALVKALKRLKQRFSPEQALFNNAFRSSSWYKDIGEVTLSSLSDRPYNFNKMNRDDRELALDFHLTDIPYNMRDFDRGAMFNGIEIRMPFMDYRLVSFLFSLPTKSKVGHGYTKRILRDAMKQKMPESIRTRTLKIGLGAPLDYWFSHELKELLLDALHSQKFKQSPYWNATEIIAFADDRFKSGERFSVSEAQQLWNILNGYLLL